MIVLCRVWTGDRRLFMDDTAFVMRNVIIIIRVYYTWRKNHRFRLRRGVQLLKLIVQTRCETDDDVVHPDTVVKLT